MIILSLIYFIMSNAVASSKNISILYSRSTFITYFFCMLFTYSILDWYFFEKSISLFNGLIYCNLTNFVFIFFLFLLSFFIIILTSFYPNQVINTNNLFALPLQNKEQKQKLYTEIQYAEEKEKTALQQGKADGALFPAKSFLDANITKGFNFTIKNLLQTQRDHYKIIEYSLITQFILIGGITLLSSNDLITIFLSIELQSYGLYILSTIYRNSEKSTSAGLTYFLLGGLSSCIILLGLSFLYINSGTTSLDGIYLIHNIVTSDSNLFSYLLTFPLFLADTEANIHTDISSFMVSYLPIFTVNFYQYTMQFSLIILLVGFLFKISAAPFHSWSPGVYDAIPTVTTTFVAIIPKISILILFFDLVYSTWSTTFDYSWANIILFSSFLSLIIGSILGLTQFKIKRLYAYSTISHVGFILLALSVHSVESIQAFFFYIIQYSLSNLNAFLILVVIGYTYINYNKITNTYQSVASLYKRYNKDINNLSPVEYIDQLKGYFYLNPIVAISLSITLYSFIGVPPLVGFFAKQMVLSSALDNGYVFMCLIAILTSVVSAVYYLYIIKHMFFEKSKYMINISLKLASKNKLQKIKASQKAITQESKSSLLNTITLSNWLTISISILSLIMLLFIFLYHEIYFLINIISILIVY